MSPLTATGGAGGGVGFSEQPATIKTEMIATQPLTLLMPDLSLYLKMQ